MLVGHRITASPRDPACSEILALGLPALVGRPHYGEFSWLQKTDTTWILYVTEADPAWPRVESLLERHRLGTHFFYNVFTDEELAEAAWFQVSALGHHGYPQPEDGWEEVVYSPDGGCERCGIHGGQVAPFRLRAEPKARHSDFVQLNWVFGELFVRQDAQSALEDAGITGLHWLAPVIHKSGEASADVRQIVIETVLQPALRTGALTFEVCEPGAPHPSPGPLYPARLQALPYCGRVKYHWGHRGQLEFDAGCLAVAPDIVKTNEWFGSGGEADRMILCSSRFRDAVLDGGLRGLSFEPVSLVAPT